MLTKLQAPRWQHPINKKHENKAGIQSGQSTNYAKRSMKVWSLFLRIAFVAFAIPSCIASHLKDDDAHKEVGNHAENLGGSHSAESHAKESLSEAGNGPEPWLISFHDDAETSHFDGVTKWLATRNCPITETINESYIKFLVANMTKADSKQY
jgi:hypothetical protein